MTWTKDVLDWHEAMGLDCSGDPQLGWSFICEEFRELREELCGVGTVWMTVLPRRDRARVLKESLDLIWVVLGNLQRHGISPAQVEAGWRELCRSNHSKVGAPRDANGKLQKGESFIPWDAERVLGGEG